MSYTQEKPKPEYYEVGKHTKARNAVRALKADAVRGEAYSVLQEIIEIDSVLVKFPNPAEEIRACTLYEETLKQRQAAAERLEKILAEHSGINKWKQSSESPYKILRTTSPDEYDLILNIVEPSSSGRLKKVATVTGAYEFGKYRLSLAQGMNITEYTDMPPTYEGCETRLAEIAEQTIGDLVQRRKFKKGK